MGEEAEKNKVENQGLKKCGIWNRNIYWINLKADWSWQKRKVSEFLKSQ